MQTKVEGLLLTKRPFQERHLVGTLLLRDGTLCSVTFYGGKGGGKKKKSSILELGFMLKVELTKPKKRQEGALYQAKEWDLIWHHQHIRHSLFAFHALYFINEVITKLGVESHLEEKELDVGHSEGLFKVLSNTLYYFDQKLSEAQEDQGQSLGFAMVSFFLAKLLIELGIFPEVGQCVLTGEIYHSQQDSTPPVRFLPDQGGFALRDSLERREEEGPHHASLQDDREILFFLKMVASTRFQDFGDIYSRRKKAPYSYLARRLFHYFCFHFQFKEEQFRTFPMIFP